MNALPAQGAAEPYRVAGGNAAEDREAVLQIWRGNLGQEVRMRAKYDWFYLRCPFGPPLLQLLRAGTAGTAVGACGAGRRRMLWKGKEIKAGVLVDLAVAPEHRSLGPALMLQQGLVAAGHAELDLLYGFPNPKAAPVFRRLGYRKFAEMQRHARVLRHARYLGRRVPAVLASPLGILADLIVNARDALRALPRRRILASWSDHADPDFDTLWQHSDHGNGLLGVRDRAHASWRFDDSPLGRTRYLLLRDRAGALQAWFATQEDDGVLHVRDFWALDAIAGVDTALIDALVHATRKAGHHALSIEMATTESRLENWRARGFRQRAGRPLFGTWSDATVAPDEELDLHITSADEDE